MYVSMYTYTYSYYTYLINKRSWCFCFNVFACECVSVSELYVHAYPVISREFEALKETHSMFFFLLSIHELLV